MVPMVGTWRRTGRGWGPGSAFSCVSGLDPGCLLCRCFEHLTLCWPDGEGIHWFFLEFTVKWEGQWERGGSDCSL